jgi:hypothetical protein
VQEGRGVKRQKAERSIRGFRVSSESEFFRSVTEHLGQCAEAAEAQVNGAVPMPRRLHRGELVRRICSSKTGVAPPSLPVELVRPPRRRQGGLITYQEGGYGR